MSQNSFVYEKKQGKRGSIRRNWDIQNNKLQDASNSGTPTVYHAYKLSIKMHEKNKWLGCRILDKKELPGHYEHLTYAEAGKIVETLKGSLAKNGLKPKEHVALYGKNIPEWLIADYACQSRSNPTVPLYDTLSPDASAYVIDHAECVAVFCDWERLSNAVAGSLKSSRVKFVVVFPLQPFEKTKENKEKYAQTISQEENKGIKVFEWDKFLTQTSDVADFPPSEKDIFTICYTSGTTGTPKGAVISHYNMMANSYSLLKVTQTYSTDSIISYLPLAHMFERAVELTMLMVGGSAEYFKS